MKARFVIVFAITALWVTPLAGNDIQAAEGDGPCAEQIEADGVSAQLVTTDELVETMEVALPDWDAPFPLFMYEVVEYELVTEFGYYRTEDGQLLVIVCSKEARIVDA
jgi:hypothetical protein